MRLHIFLFSSLSLFIVELNKITLPGYRTKPGWGFHAQREQAAGGVQSTDQRYNKYKVAGFGLAEKLS